ncbi:MAG: hypothetical protein R6V62_05940 [Candidatus Fermentibacteraceae bacterium]
MTAGILLCVAASLSRTVFLDIELFREQDLTRAVFTVTGLQGDDMRFSRVSQDYDPEYMSVTFLGASREVPVWGVDTLTGAGGWPRTLMVAMPGIEPGTGVTWTFSAEEFGENARKGFWWHWSGTPGPDSVRVSVHSSQEYGVHLRGFTEVEPGVFVSLSENTRAIWLGSPSTWRETGGMVMGAALSVLSAGDPFPPDLTEAVIQAGAAGVSVDLFLGRARTLISDNIRVISPRGEAALRVRSLQAILDTRYATPLETAMLFCAMARRAGHEARLAAARNDLPPFPYPIGWNRFLVRVDTPDGALWFEPSAPLSPAGYVESSDTLFVLVEGMDQVLTIDPNPGTGNLCRENWTMDPSAGTFTLTLDCRGGFDMELRERLGGMPARDALLALSDWFRVSGIHLFPTSCVTSDFFDLATPATLTVNGVLSGSSSPVYERVPELAWRSPGERVVEVNGSPVLGKVLLRIE